MSSLSVEIHESSSKLWPPVEALVSDRIKEQRLPVRLVASSENVEVLLIPAKRVSVEILNARPKLRCLIIPHAGVDPNVKKALEETGRETRIQVYNVHHNAASTAEYACTLLFALARRVVPSDRYLRENNWSYRNKVRSGSEGAQLLYRGVALILGLGTVGRRIARVLIALGMRVLATRWGASRQAITSAPPSAKKQCVDGDAQFAMTEEGVEVYAADQIKELLPLCSALVVSLPLTNSTRGLLGRDKLAMLRPGCCIVNVGRAEVIDEDALWHALTDGNRSLAFASDVWWQEPLPEQDSLDFKPSRYPFGTLDNTVLSPHHAGGVGLEGIEEERADALAELLSGLTNMSPAPTPVDLEIGY